MGAIGRMPSKGIFPLNWLGLGVFQITWASDEYTSCWGCIWICAPLTI